ncbi:alpha/beta hydrolase [Tardiphaga alba]|uniref:Alpha/beta hydrolase n=1 Tax=Tardiphaga alba TaxID=340268 RepID=A0ABX8AG18_9BRAD|nr:alpha/beta hydrolase [Tardiphaga alba]
MLCITSISIGSIAAAPAKKNGGSSSLVDSTSPTVVLVHGAWADGSSWSKVIPLLQARGVKVLGVQNPLTSLADDVAATKKVIADASGPVVLVGHSWAGTVITEAGVDPQVKALVYVAAFANKEGQSGGDLVNAYPKTPALGTIWDNGRGFLRQTEHGMIENFAPDLPKKDARTLFVTQAPLSASTFGDKVTVAAWRTVPSWYIVSANDRVISPQMERDLAAMMKAKTTVLQSSHVSLLSHPREVAAVILDAVSTVAKEAKK